MCVVKLHLWILMATDTLPCLLLTHYLFFSWESPPPFQSNQKATMADGFITGTSNYFHCHYSSSSFKMYRREQWRADSLFCHLFRVTPLIPSKQGERRGAERARCKYRKQIERWKKKSVVARTRLRFSQQSNMFPYDVITLRTWKMTDVRCMWQSFQTRSNLFFNPLFIQGCNTDTVIGPHSNSLWMKSLNCSLYLWMNFLHSPGFSFFKDVFQLTSSELHLARGNNSECFEDSITQESCNLTPIICIFFWHTVTCLL